MGGIFNILGAYYTFGRSLGAGVIHHLKGLETLFQTICSTTTFGRIFCGALWGDAILKRMVKCPLDPSWVFFGHTVHPMLLESEVRPVVAVFSLESPIFPLLLTMLNIRMAIKSAI